MMRGFAKIDLNGRVIRLSQIAETCESDPAWIEVSNLDYVDEACTNGIDDFVIEDGLAVYSPTPEKLSRIAEEKRREEWMERGPDRTDGLEADVLDHDEAITGLYETIVQAQLDTDEAIVTMYELMNGGVA